MKRVLLCIASLVLIASTTSNLFVEESWAFTPKRIVQSGPGNRIAGIDISRWQHPNEAPIDFRQMYRAGVRFVMIKGADAQTAADATAKKYLLIDRQAAQRALLYTGFYYYAYLPDSTDTAFIAKDAKAQAQKVIWRIGEMGGYNRRDLPVALDMENNCQRLDSQGICRRYMARSLVTLWAKTWLQTVAEKTGRNPIFYSYPQFLENAMAGDPSLRQYPLWMARYSLDPALASAQPNAKTAGCYAHPWSNANCTAQWQFWQYSSCGIASKYGVPGNRVDLNVFSGSPARFLALIRGTWAPEPSESLPQNEPTTMQLVSQSSRSTNDPATFTIDVLRPDGTPVVTGGVDIKSLDPALTIPIQSSIRSATGRWTITAKGLSAGNYLAMIEFSDQSGTHAPNTFPVQFTVVPGEATPTPTSSTSPSATPKPSKTKSPAPDPCAGQIRN